MVACFFSGFSGTSSGTNPGSHDMADSAGIGGAVAGGAHKLTYTDEDAAVAAIQNDPCQPVVLVGHSLGADEAVETAEQLQALGICVDLMIQLDSIGVGDEVKPKNVTKGVNIWSTSRDGLDGASSVSGSENIGVDGTNHTDIDENPANDTSTGSVGAGGGDHAGKNAWQIVQGFVAGLPKSGCNCPKGCAAPLACMMNAFWRLTWSRTSARERLKSALYLSEISETVVRAITGESEQPVPFSQLITATERSADDLTPPLKHLIETGRIYPWAGELREPYFGLEPGPGQA